MRFEVMADGWFSMLLWVRVPQSAVLDEHWNKCWPLLWQAGWARASVGCVTGSSPRGVLRQAFAQLQGASCAVYPLFCADFQQLLGVPMNTDPRLSQFICNSCHTQFYRCHSILLDFRNRVNLTPACRDRWAHSSHSFERYLIKTYGAFDESVWNGVH